MAVTLKKKITLRRKGEAADFTFSGKLKVKLFWSSPTDLDLCLFFKKKNGEVGGIFSNEYRGRKSDLGNLNEFPFMLHMGDNKEPLKVRKRQNRSMLPTSMRSTKPMYAS